MSKKIQCIVILLFFLNCRCLSQTYISFAPALTNTAGTIADKSNLTLEAGKQWDVFSLGLAIGKTTLSRVAAKDTSVYMELRPNLNIFQEGKFTNTFTAGIGYVFGAKESLLTEVTYGIEYSYTEKIHFNVDAGQYFYSGRESASNATFFGVSVAYFFAKNQSGAIIKRNKP